MSDQYSKTEDDLKEKVVEKRQELTDKEEEISININIYREK